MYREEDFFPLSAIQHYAYCPRQCALIHLEMAWSENRFTAEGRVLHDRAHSVRSETRGDVKTVAGLQLRSRFHGVSGTADVVEFHRRDGIWQPFPVEYKRGRPKTHDWDRVQLCMQAFCLEEMLSVAVPCGALFYGKTRRRENVAFSQALREETALLAQEIHALLGRTALPPPANDDRCPGCSLQDICLPGLRASRPASAYLESLRGEP